MRLLRAFLQAKILNSDILGHKMIVLSYLQIRQGVYDECKGNF